MQVLPPPIDVTRMTWFMSHASGHPNGSPAPAALASPAAGLGGGPPGIAPKLPQFALRPALTILPGDDPGVRGRSHAIVGELPLSRVATIEWTRIMNSSQPSRRAVIQSVAGAGILAAGVRSQTTSMVNAQSGRALPMTPPIGWTGETPGDGFEIGHGFACENTWFNPGWWITGYVFFAIERDTV